MDRHVRYMHLGKRSPYELLPRAERMKIKAMNKQKKMLEALSTSETEEQTQGTYTGIMDGLEQIVQHRQEVVADQQQFLVARSDSSNTDF